MIVYTIGYGGRSLDELIDLLKRYNVERVVDIRRWVKSIRLPEFSGENLSRILPQYNIDYVWLDMLGGYRRFGVDIEDYGIANCFESEGFRAYATYITRSPNVKPYLEKLARLVDEKTSVLMCREKIPWRCHRKILSDYLLAKGFKVIHIIDHDKTYIHRLSRCAIIVDGELDYT
ncbi:MAG: hypothetical protein B6U89_07560 [Desulfurococcales archaeon ex4484_58]|nr:MAG: hypothetical protein B6U89_07560 [Desulfurococcales archaeon ex4484_58]